MDDMKKINENLSDSFDESRASGNTDSNADYIDPLTLEQEVNKTRLFDGDEAQHFRSFTNDENSYYYQKDFEEQTEPAEEFMPEPPKKKKEPKFVSRKAFAAGLICCMVASSGLTLGGLKALGAFDKTVMNGSSGTVSATNYTLAKSTATNKSVQEIIEMNKNAVVEIRTESISNDSWMSNYVKKGAGSGVIVDSNGYIMTCAHVINGANSITVTTKDGKEYKAEIIGSDELTDVAILKIEGSGFTAATYGDSSSLQVGDLAVAIGNPLGQLGGSASTGIISSLDRTLAVEGKNMSLLQTDASINPGNSGGGLFDGNGNLIGIVVAKSSGSDVEGLGFAIPINQAADVGKQLIESGKVTGRALLGVKIIDLTSIENAQRYGVRHTGIYIAEVAGKEASAAGFQKGDMLYYVGDTQITSESDLRSELLKHKPGEKIKVTVIRDEKTVDLETVLTGN